jgi:hypothetical protein
MNRKLLISIVVFSLFLAVLTGCRGAKNKTSVVDTSGVEPTAVESTSVPAPDAKTGTVTGKVFSTPADKFYPKAPVWLAEVYRQGGEGVYVLDHAFSPGVYADEQGVFTITNVAPKEYVIVIGDPDGTYVVIPDEAGKARVWNVEAGKILDVGKLDISLSP